jgi:hypothetical protein
MPGSLSFKVLEKEINSSTSLGNSLKMALRIFCHSKIKNAEKDLRLLMSSSGSMSSPRYSVRSG